jgi:hypothetical protein
MRDLEFILRYFALNTDFIKNNTTSSISLKKYLNEFMGQEESQELIVIDKRRKEFNDAISLYINHIGENAFLTL